MRRTTVLLLLLLKLADRGGRTFKIQASLVLLLLSTTG